MLRGPAAAVVSILFFIGATAMAQTTVPTTQAALDQSTPRGALKLFFRSEARSDGNTLRDLLMSSGAAEEGIVAAIADKKNADREMTDALEAKFPVAGPTPSQQAESMLPPVYDKIDQSAQTVNGDDATLTAPGAESKPVMLHRKDGKWRIPISVLLATVDAATLAGQAHQLEIQVAVMHATAADVTAGKYADASKAIEDVKKRMSDAVLADHNATAATHP